MQLGNRILTFGKTYEQTYRLYRGGKPEKKVRTYIVTPFFIKEKGDY